MNELDLIQQLSRNLKPVKRQPTFWVRWGILFSIFLSVVSVGIYIWFLIKGEFHVPEDRSFLELVILLATFVSCSFLLTRSVSPHLASPQTSWYPSLLTVLWVGVLVFVFGLHYLEDGPTALEALQYQTWFCPLVIASMAVPMALLSYFYIARGAVLFARATFFYWSLLALSTGAIGLSFICPWADPLHELLWHVLPVIMITFVLFQLQLKLWKTKPVVD